MTTRGEAAEELVAERVRAVVDDGVAVPPNVHWLLRDHGSMGKGEADLVIGDPERGILVLEVKAGEIRRDDLHTPDRRRDARADGSVDIEHTTVPWFFVGKITPKGSCD